jgi:hypothetical protein
VSGLTEPGGGWADERRPDPSGPQGLRALQRALARQFRDGQGRSAVRPARGAMAGEDEARPRAGGAPVRDVQQDAERSFGRWSTTRGRTSRRSRFTRRIRGPIPRCRHHQGLIRNIEVTSDADVAYDTAIECAVDRGFGYYRINTRYTCEDTFDQDIVIERVSNPLTVYGDPNSTAADSSDWNEAWVRHDADQGRVQGRISRRREGRLGARLQGLPRRPWGGRR